MSLNREHQAMLEKIMGEMRGVFPSHFRLTLLARNSSLLSPDKDILITEEPLEKVCDALNRIRMEQLLSPVGVNFDPKKVN